MSEFSSNRARSALPLFLTVFDLNSKQYKPPKHHVDEMKRVDCCALPGIFAMPAINILACELLKPTCQALNYQIGVLHDLMLDDQLKGKLRCKTKG